MMTTSRMPMRVRHETRRRTLHVARVETVSPRMRRIIFAGDELAGFVSAAADDHVKLFFVDSAGQAIGRDYTPRRFDAVRQELTIEFVIHGEGPAASWARHAEPGQSLDIGGPRGSTIIADDYDTYLLAGDEAALPAIARFLEEMRPGARALVLIEVADAAEERHLPTAANASITWLHRHAAAGTSDVLDRALRDLPLPAGDTFAWIAGEIETARRLRRYLVEEEGLPRSHIKAAGYWRIGDAGAHVTLDD